MKADGSDKRNLTKTTGLGEVEFRAMWSPDGKKIACVSYDLEKDDNATFGRSKVIDVAAAILIYLTGSYDVFNIF